MDLREFYSAGRFGLSYELFPPKTDSGMQSLVDHVGRLAAYSPDFVTCTYGAGGSTQSRTLDVCERVKTEFGFPVASHLTVVGSTREQLIDYLEDARSRGVDFLVALRGDPPKGQDEFRPVAGGLRYANELVELVRGEGYEFGIAVAGYPETHIEASSPEVDLVNLKRKVDAGADIVVTQLFYDNDDFFRFRDRCMTAGIDIPIVPGILPVTDLAQIRRITSMCGAKLPATFVERLGARDDEGWQFEVGVDFARQQVQQLIDAAVPGLHFYVLNKSRATLEVLQGVRLPSCRS